MEGTEVCIEKEIECAESEEHEKEWEAVSENEDKQGIISDNRGVGVVEVILILVVLIALVLIFKEQLGNMVTKAMQTLEKSINEVLS